MAKQVVQAGAQPKQTPVEDNLVVERGTFLAGRLSLALYLLALSALVLPFISVECGSSRTEPITGIELLTYSEPTYIGHQEPDDIQDIRAVVWRVAGATWLVTLILVIGVYFATKLLMNGDSLTVWHLAAMGPAAVVAHAVQYLAGIEALGPETHHHAGFFVFGGLIAAQLPITVAVTMRNWRNRPPRWIGPRTWLEIVVALAALGLITGVAISRRSNDLPVSPAYSPQAENSASTSPNR